MRRFLRRARRTALTGGLFLAAALSAAGAGSRLAEGSHVDLDGDGELELSFSDPGRAPGDYLLIQSDGDGDPDAIFVGTAGGAPSGARSRSTATQTPR